MKKLYDSVTCAGAKNAWRYKGNSRKQEEKSNAMKKVWEVVKGVESIKYAQNVACVKQER